MSRYTAFDVSCHIVNSSIDAGHPVSNLQLQKILYFVQLEYCAKTSTLLFEDDFEAWQYGPVVPSVYRTFSIWGGSKITTAPSSPAKNVSSEDRIIIDPVIAEYRLKEPWDLVEKAHEEGSPWFVTISKKGDRGVIDKKLLFEAC